MDQKTSILVKKQLPEFVREEYPLFTSFLEAYYEFLENKQPEIKNDLLSASKKLRLVNDVDLSIDEFEEQFFNTFASLIPKDTRLDKATLIKNILPIYLSKGSEKGFKLLFRLLFADELEIKYPRNEVLRPSTSKWTIENVIKLTDTVFTEYVADGNTKDFKLAPCRCPITNQPLPINIILFVNDVLVQSGFYILRESKKLVFDNAPSANSKIKIFYRGYDFETLVNRRIVGLSSGASSIVEKIGTRIINNQRITELFVDQRNVFGNFRQGEELSCDVFVDDVLVNIILSTSSSIVSIELLDGGSSYNVGDPVSISTAESEIPGSAIISKVFSGTLNQIIVEDGGAGFVVTDPIFVEGVPNTTLDLAIASIDSTGLRTANTFTVYTDVISDIDPANTTLDANSWNFPSSSLAEQNLSSIINQTLGNTSFTGLGEITSVAILLSNIAFSTAPDLQAQPARLILQPQTSNTSSNVILSIDTFGSLGKLVVDNPGTGYAVGDELIIINQPMSFGVGAEAEITQVSNTGGIIQAQFLPNKITGTANVTSVSNVMVQGINTIFEDELIVGDTIMIGGETKTVVEITSNTSLNVDSFFSQIKIEKPIRLFGKNLIGGQGYKQDKLPTIQIDSETGSNGSISVTAIMGDGEDLLGLGTKRPGEIEEISIINPGSGYLSLPLIDLTQFGDGTAKATVQLTPVFERLPGRWTSTDSILSSADRKIQGRNYYSKYSYVTTSQIEFSKYKKVFKDLMHPAGLKPYAEYEQLVALDTSVDVSGVDSTDALITISGLVSVQNNNTYVTGIGTKFEQANTLGILTTGSEISIGSDIRIVDSILSNTVLLVTQDFTANLSSQELVILQQ
jgi:hypothetical protein